MSNLEGLFKRAVSASIDQRGKPAILGKTDGTLYWVSPAGTTYRTRVWARIGAEASRQEVVVDCLSVSPQVDMPVRIDHVNGVLTVIDVDSKRAIEFSGDRPGAKVGAHAWLHNRLGPDPVFIDGLQMLPLLVTPTNSPDLTVTVQGGAYTLDDGSLQMFETAVSGSFSSYVPGTGYHFVIVCLDRPNDAIVIVDGADVTNSSDALFGKATVSKADIEAVTISSDYLPLAVVLLYAGQTQIKARDIVYDLRPANVGGGGGGTPGGSDTQVQFNNSNAFGGDADLTYDTSTGTLTAAGRIIIGSGETVDSDAKLGIILSTSTSGTLQSIPFHNPKSGDFNETALDFYFEDDAGAQALYGRFEAIQLARTAGSEDGGFDFLLNKSGTLTNVLSMYASTDLIQFKTMDVLVRGSSNDNLFFTDFSANSVNIGTNGSAGSLLTVSPTQTVFNNDESDIDFRIAGNGVTNGYFYDAGNNMHGFGTGSPAFPMHVMGTACFQKSATTITGLNRFYNPDTTGNNGVILNFDTDTTGTGATTQQQVAQIAVEFTIHDHATRSANILFRPTIDGAFQNPAMGIGSGIVVGSPTGGYPGAGWINVSGGVKLNNTNYTNPDYAVYHYFHGDTGPFAKNPGAKHYRGLVPLDALEDYLRKNMHLPNRWESENIFEWADMAQMWCEELAIYITQLHTRVKELENGR